MYCFDDIAYLQQGSDKQRRVWELLTRHCIFEKLAPFDPILTGTIPIEIDTPDSDLDIICHCPDVLHFESVLQSLFGPEQHFRLHCKVIGGRASVVCSFEKEGFTIEIFGQDQPSRLQNAYRHLLIEARLLEERGPEFRQQIIELKQQGLKTEPAFARLLGLEGDAYEALLRLES